MKRILIMLLGLTTIFAGVRGAGPLSRIPASGSASGRSSE